MSEDVNASLGRQHGFTSPTSVALGAEKNLQDGSWDANLFRPPDYWVYIFTVSDREFAISQPPLIRSFTIRPKIKGQRYTLVAKLPCPFLQIDREGAVGDLMVRAHQGEKVAQSICNPNNPTLNQDASLPAQTILGLGVDLNCQGVFWSRNAKPTEDELKGAERRRERYYEALLERARTLEISNPKELEYLINQDYHMAAEYFGVETSWHRKLVKFEECPNCAEQIKPGVAFHRHSSGIICIVDPERAAKAGVTAASVGSVKA